MSSSLIRYVSSAKAFNSSLFSQSSSYHLLAAYHKSRPLNTTTLWLHTQFTNKKTNRNSHAYRVTYRSMDRSLTNEEVNDIQDVVRSKLVGDLKVELR